jgi:bifunctional NMN adenylyltransferase/nudix hydrolase
MRQYLSENLKIGFSIYPLNDYRYSNQQWVTDTCAAVDHLMDTNHQYFAGFDRKPILFGHTKPDTGYLQDFKLWPYEELHSGWDGCATEMRDKEFSFAEMGQDNVTFSDHLQLTGQELHNLLADRKALQKEAKDFATYLYKDTLQFVCSDVVVECAGHVLMIKRGNSPGLGCWAWPGGFKENNETFYECALRELRQETGLRIPLPALMSSAVEFEGNKMPEAQLVNYKIYDSPDRDMGIPRITVAYHLKVQPNRDGTMPKTKARDDARETQWVPFYDFLNHYKCHSDHQDIGYDLLNAFPTPAHLNPAYPKYSKTI